MGNFFKRFLGTGNRSGAGGVAPAAKSAEGGNGAHRSIQSMAEPVSLPSRGPRHEGHDVPFYPGRGKAVTVDPPQKLVDSQHEIIGKLRQASALTYEDFDAYIMPVIRNYARFVHLLPASETDHHSDLGGLFRHGLEVAFHASRRCEGKEFGLNEDPSIRKFQFFRWRACALIGGMVHDIGKAVIDVGAIDETGKEVWNPHVHALYDWALENRLEFYFVSWNPARLHREHDAISATALDRIIPVETKRWMGQHRGRVAYDSMLLALAHSENRNNPLIDIIHGADMASVDLDLKDAHRRLAAVGEGGTRGLGSRFLRAIWDKLNNGDWPVNIPGLPIWNTEAGVFAIYPVIAKEIIEHLRAKGEKGIPLDAPTVLQILSDCGHIAVYSDDDGNTYNVQKFMLETKDRNGHPIQINGTGIRFVNEVAIPDYFVLPPPLPVTLFSSDGKPLTSGGLVDTSTGEILIPATTTSPKVVAAEPIPAPEIDFGGEEVVVVGGYEGDDGEPVTAPAATRPTPVAMHAAVQPEVEAEPESIIPLRDRATELDARDQTIEQGIALNALKFPPDNADQAQEWLDNQGALGMYLGYIIGKFNQQRVQWGKQLFWEEEDDRLLIEYPKCWAGAGVPTGDIHDMLAEHRWVDKKKQTQPSYSHFHPHEGGTVQVLRFTEDHSHALRLLMPRPAAEEKRKFLGPFIDEDATSRISSLQKPMPQDQAIICNAFHAFAVSKAATDAPWYEQTIRTVKELMTQFHKEHKLNGEYLRQHLINGGVVLVSNDRALEFNPDFNPIHDPAIPGGAAG